MSSRRRISERPGDFSRAEKRGLYKAIYGRRDVRRFLPQPIADPVIQRLLGAAHHAGSVGFMQPWSFVLIANRTVKESVKQVFERANLAASAVFEGERRELYSQLKLEGILEAPVNVCVTCDPTR